MTNPEHQLQVQRTSELQEREHEIRKLRLDAKISKLRLELNPPKAEKVDARQDRLNRIIQRFEDAVTDCRTIQQSVLLQQQYNAEIDSDPDLSPKQRKDFKDLIDDQFANIRFELGAEIKI